MSYCQLFSSVILLLSLRCSSYYMFFSFDAPHPSSIRTLTVNTDPYLRIKEVAKCINSTAIKDAMVVQVLLSRKDYR
jgi:hypothetical protein